jgi:hypothetical protein
LPWPLPACCNRLLIERIEVHRRQHDRRESAFHHQRVDVLARIGEEDIRRRRAQQATQLVLAFKTDDEEDAGLLTSTRNAVSSSTLAVRVMLRTTSKLPCSSIGVLRVFRSTLTFGCHWLA